MIAAVLALAALAVAPGAGPAPDTARWALVAGANDGGPERPALRWAVRDAERVAAVFAELGGVAPERAVLLRNPRRADLEAAIAQVTGAIVQARAADPRLRAELVFYYSGHADTAGLLLGPEAFAYARLRAALDAVPAEVRVVVVDACASGAMLRAKGGHPTAPFLDAEPATGHAYVTSAAADEVAQESDRLEASFFTDAFVAGLRGAADTSGDGRVTLVEAYDHAFRETLSGTSETLAGPQHPSYDLALAGQGDVVLTALDAVPRLVVGPEVAGRVVVRTPSGRLVAEAPKDPGAALALALPPGRYRVAVIAGGRILAADVAIPGALSASDLRDVGPAIATRERGASILVDALPRAARTTSIRVSLVPLLGFEGGGADLAVDGLDLALLADRVASVRGAQVAALYAETGDLVGAQVAAVAVARRVRGAQIGAVTYAKRVEGLALGLVPWVDDGVHQAEAWADTHGGINFGYRLGPRHLYVAGSVGWRPGAGACAAPGLGLALGTRVDLGRVAADLDLGVRAPLPDCAGTLEVAPRVLVALDVVPGFALVAGGGLTITPRSSADPVAPFGLLGLRFFE